LWIERDEGIIKTLVKAADELWGRVEHG